jgi:uncharacterized protein YjbJ (UPF0337 family)
MYWDSILKGQWKAIRGSMKTWWGRLTDDEIAQVDGHAERLVGLLQRKYGFSAARA